MFNPVLLTMCVTVAPSPIVIVVAFILLAVNVPEPEYSNVLTYMLPLSMVIDDADEFITGAYIVPPVTKVIPDEDIFIRLSEVRLLTDISDPDKVRLVTVKFVEDAVNVDEERDNLFEPYVPTVKLPKLTAKAL